MKHIDARPSKSDPPFLAAMFKSAVELLIVAGIATALVAIILFVNTSTEVEGMNRPAINVQVAVGIVVMPVTVYATAPLATLNCAGSPPASPR
jgi:uncharacterized membrane protein YidH (DUF202 family)